MATNSTEVETSHTTHTLIMERLREGNIMSDIIGTICFWSFMILIALHCWAGITKGED